MGPEIVAPVGFFVTVIVIVLGLPLVRAAVKRTERQSLPPAHDAQTAERLARIEAAVESIAIEVERISEAQRFTTKLLSDAASSRRPDAGA